ncbi:hypothetical protein F5051DRAFT_411707 [Lentinula edodes]|nr:hypothetical protein F5051DRAFT_411707 [Lentinula edodes]
MTSNNRRNKHGKGANKDPNSNFGRSPGPSREQSATPGQTSSPLPGGSGGRVGVGLGPGPGEQIHTGFNGTVPKHIYDFSKALAGEVRILLAEVGQLRDERRQLQYEIAEIMALKSKNTGSQEEYRGMPGGMYDHPDALAYAMAGLTFPPHPHDPLALTPVDPPPPQEPPAPASPAWRTVHKRAERKPRTKKATDIPQSIPSPSQVPPLEIPKPNVPAWAQWRPNPLLSPTPRHGSFSGGGGPGPATPPPRAGLFGPPSPPPK